MSHTSTTVARAKNPTVTPDAHSEDAAETSRRTPRQRLLDAADELFYAEGVQSVGIDRIIERAGVAKASLYSSFGSKEGLVSAYLDGRHERLLTRWEQAVDNAGPDPVDQMLAVFDAHAALFDLPGYNGCAFAAARAEAPAGGRIDAVVTLNRRDLQALLERLATAAGAADPARLAVQLRLLYDGAVTAAKLDAAPDLAGTEREAAQTLIRAALDA